MREALLLSDRLADDLESAWQECSAKFPELDHAERLRLRAAFEAGYRGIRDPGRVVIVPAVARPGASPPEERPATA